ncbi:unnamed protein product [Oikopleura dioica]|uniref:Uncharacterized protein n=1 Tax=Oikopleura dioica TaxID=34765 RepID=E4XXA6_OIKDI|nr:unnamed protein product [Oikopleura dioica]
MTEIRFDQSDTPGEQHVVTQTGALVQLIENSDGIEFVTKVEPNSGYNIAEKGFYFHSYSTCGVGFEEQNKIIICSPTDDVFGCYFYFAGNTRFTRFREEIPYFSAGRSNMVYFNDEIHIFTESIIDQTISHINSFSKEQTWRRWSVHTNERRDGAWSKYAMGIYPVADDKPRWPYNLHKDFNALPRDIRNACISKKNKGIMKNHFTERHKHLENKYDCGDCNDYREVIVPEFIENPSFNSFNNSVEHELISELKKERLLNEEESRHENILIALEETGSKRPEFEISGVVAEWARKGSKNLSLKRCLDKIKLLLEQHYD